MGDDPPDVVRVRGRKHLKVTAAGAAEQEKVLDAGIHLVTSSQLSI